MKQPTSSRTLLTIGATVNSFAYAIIVFALGVLLPTLSVKFQLSETEKGLLFLVQNLAIFLPILASGPILDRFGRRPVLVTGAVFVTIATASIGLVPSYALLLTVLFLLGLGGGFTNISTNTLITDLYPENPGRALNWVNAGFGAGAITIPLLYSLVGVELGVPVFMSLLALVPLVPLLIFLLAHFPQVPRVARFKASAVLQVLASPLVFYLGAVLFFYVALEVSTAGWLKDFFIETHGMTDRTSGFVLTGFSVMLMLGRLAAAVLLERVRGAVLLVWASAMSCLGLSLMVLSGSLVVSVAGVLIAGLAYAPVFPTTLGTVGEQFRTYPATVMGVVIAIGFLGPTLVPFLIGVLEGNMKVLIGAAVLMLVSQLLVLRSVNRRAHSSPVLPEAADPEVT
jgi:fucose permease